MGQRDNSNLPGVGGVVDCATLYLCRRGQQWVVVIESPRITGALRLRDFGRDSYDTQFDLLRRASRACPDAATISTDGALESTDYEWRLEIRSVEAHEGDLGIALHREFSAEPTANRTAPSQGQTVPRCQRGRLPEVSGRPRSF